jgi:hypothetical protein
MGQRRERQNREKKRSLDEVHPVTRRVRSWVRSSTRTLGGVGITGEEAVGRGLRVETNDLCIWDAVIGSKLQKIDVQNAHAVEALFLGSILL